ncbi:S41 family peptidase [Pontibacter arcticus]|uniref:Peptidase s41 n=1 Tax=Pontibacter arcticus TaxID=2080288 RepID=A0A364REJ7_9BACT|nr:S41 family peptidase [Pontibacter arcticus]RAU82687.1 peptidase s41 [Pontibacter arcticus]
MLKTYLKIVLTGFLLFASITSIQAQDCKCTEVIDAAADAYEKNYSLFIYKVTDQNRDLYNAHKNVIRNKAELVTDLSDCKAILNQYLHFFRDGHTYVLNSDKKTFYKEEIKINEKQFKKAYSKNNYNLNQIIGIWENGSYTVAIVPNPAKSSRERDFVGIVLSSTNPEWKQSDVKFELTSKAGASYQANFMMGDHSVKKTEGTLVGKSLLEIDGSGDWNKVWPEVKGQQPKNEIQAKYKQFHLSYIGDIPYLRLPDFYSVERSFVDSLMKSNHDKIMKSDFMIIDVRGNSGGSDGTYFPVLPYVLSGPIKLPINGFWLSEYNIQKVMDYKTGKPGKKVEEYTKQEKEDYDYMMANKGTAAFENPNDFWTFKTDTLYNGPKKIVILTDKETASSGETFVFRANQSNKVVVYGQNTAGVVDGFNGLSKDIGCFEVAFPSSYRAKDIKQNPIDPYGIAPDVFVNEKVDALNYAIEHMRHLLKNESINQ